jgi:ABC-type phosphate/phosphonate transport system permease subunit
MFPALGPKLPSAAFTFLFRLRTRRQPQMKTSIFAVVLFAFSITAKVKALLALIGAGILGTTITAQTPGPLVGPNSPDADSTPGRKPSISV